MTPRGRDLLDQVTAMFLEEGFGHLTIAELVDRLHCSRRTLYELAPSKEELVLIVLDRWMRQVGRVAHDAVQASDDPAERIRVFLTVGQSDLRRFGLRFAEDLARQPAAQRLFDEHVHYATSVVRSMIEEGVAAGSFVDLHPGVVAAVIDAALERLHDPAVLRATGLTYEDAVADLIALIEGGLFVDRSPGKATRKVRTTTS